MNSPLPPTPSSLSQTHHMTGKPPPPPRKGVHSLEQEALSLRRGWRDPDRALDPRSLELALEGSQDRYKSAQREAATPSKDAEVGFPLSQQSKHNASPHLAWEGRPRCHPASQDAFQLY